MSNTNRPVRATLVDVARKAGVSVTTVSLVLANKAAGQRISQAVLERVRGAAEELDYTPNRLVHSMQRGYTQILSLYSGFRNRVPGDLYMDTLSTAIERAAGAQGYDILVNCNYSRSPEDTYRHLNGGIVDGVLFFAPAADDPLLAYLRGSRLPSVLINARDAGGLISTVRDDVVSGMRQVAECLVSHGHSRVLALTEPGFDNPDQNERIELLREGLRPAGIEVETRIGGDQITSVVDCIKQVRSDGMEFSAIFCWRDFLAYKVLEACELLGISVPEEVSVIGYDGLPWPAGTTHTAASVYVDMDLLAHEAVKLLADQIQQADDQPVERLVPVAFREGTTIAAPGSGKK